jgi:hypothetical protein
MAGIGTLCLISQLRIAGCRFSALCSRNVGSCLEPSYGTTGRRVVYVEMIGDLLHRVNAGAKCPRHRLAAISEGLLVACKGFYQRLALGAPKTKRFLERPEFR